MSGAWGWSGSGSGAGVAGAGAAGGAVATSMESAAAASAVAYGPSAAAATSAASWQGHGPAIGQNQVCACGEVFMDDASICRRCGTAQAPGGWAGQQRPSSEVRCACGEIFLDDRRFCQKCGAPRPEASASSTRPEAERSRGHARKPSEPRPSLHFEVFVFFGSYWLEVYLGVLLVLMLFKGLWFDYPGDWQLIETILLVLCFALQRLQGLSGSYANRAQSVAGMGAFLGLSVPVALFVGYFAGVQVYLLRFEFVLGAVSLVLLCGQVLLAVVAGVTFSAGGRDKALVVAGALLAAGSLAMVITTMVVDVGHDHLHRMLISGLVLAPVGVCIALISGICMLIGTDGSEELSVGS